MPAQFIKRACVAGGLALSIVTSGVAAGSAVVGLQEKTQAAEQKAARIPSKEEVLAAIDAYRANPAAPDAFVHVEKIMAYAHASDAVDIKLNFRYTPWARGNIPELAEDRLIGAFVAGNMEPQLKEGKKGHRPYAGTLYQLAVYEALRKENLAPYIKRFEMLIKHRNAGTLKDRVR